MDGEPEGRHSCSAWPKQACGVGVPGGKDDELIEKLRALVREGREYLAGGDFSVAMGRMRVAHDLLSIYIIRLSDE